MKYFLHTKNYEHRDNTNFSVISDKFNAAGTYTSKIMHSTAYLNCT